jgi:tRNA-dihydrouridine synthase
VLGNGDVWEAEDALRMMRTTGCDGVVVGRGCLGRPWLFRDLAEVFEGRPAPNPPALGPVVDIMLEHLRLLCAWTGEHHGVRMFRKHAAWYTKGFRGSSRVRTRIMTSTTVDDVVAALSQLDRDERFPPSAMRVPRGKTGGTQCVALPPGYLDDLDDDTPPCPMAEDATSGG